MANRPLTLGLVAAALAGCAFSATAQGSLLGDGVSPQELARRVEKAAQHPLGSRENPVRVLMPPGEQAYLARLRCSNGAAPVFQRTGSFGIGVFGNVIDGYHVECRGGEPKSSVVFMDMYHPGHVETAAPPGFTITPPQPPPQPA